MATSYTDQGIAAYNAGDREQAAQLLTQAVRDDTEKMNPDAWFYMAQLMNDPDKKRQCLERVIRLDPNYPDAQSQLDELNGGGSGASQAADGLRSEPAASDSGVSIGLLSAIPGAPPKVGPIELTAAAQDFAKRSQAALTMNTDTATENPSWWSVFTTAMLVSTLTGLFYVIQQIIISIRSETAVDFPGILTITFVVMLVGAGAAYAGAFASYWYATKQAGGNGSMLDHFQAAITLWAPASILSGLFIPVEALGIATGETFRTFRHNILTLDEVILQGIVERTGFSWALTLILLAATVFTLFLMNKRFSKLHGLSGASGWITGILMLVVVTFMFF